MSVCLVDEVQAAEMLGLSPSFLQARRVRGGGPPFVRISRRCVRYDVEDLKQWAEERKRCSTADDDGES